MSGEALPKGKDTTNSAKKIVAALQRGITPNAPLPSSQIVMDAYTTELIAKLEAKTTIDAKIRLLLAELQSDQLARKGRAVIQLNPLLQDIAIPSSMVTEIWARAKVCLSSPDVHVRQETLQLMAQCIELQRDDLHAWQRVTYYDIIQKHGVNVEELSYLEHALYQLIEEGKNVAEVSGTLLDLLSRWIGFCSANSTGHHFDDSECGKQYHVAFFMSERVFQYSFSRFEEQDVANFIDFLCRQIGTTTTMLDVIGKILDILEIIPRYGGVVPVAAVNSIIDFICAYASSRLTEQYSDRFWQIMQTLLRLDHIAQKSLSILANLPAQAPAPGTGRNFTPRHWQKFRIRGSLQFLGKCLEAQVHGEELKATLSASRALDAIYNALTHSDISIASAAINLLIEILSTDELVAQLTYEDWDIIWNALSLLVREFYELFRTVEITPSDSVSSIASESGSAGDDRQIHGLLKQLERLVQIFQDLISSSRYTGSLSRCVTFQMSLSKTIPDPCDNFILRHYDQYHLCMPTSSNWLTECEVILEDFVRDDTKLPDTRIKAIQILTKNLPLLLEDDEKTNDDFFRRVILPLLRLLRKERNGEVCSALIQLAVYIGSSNRERWALEVCKLLNICATETPAAMNSGQDKGKSLNWNDTETMSLETIGEESCYPDINLQATKGMVDIFELSLSREATMVSQMLFENLVHLVATQTLDSTLRIEALDVLLRLRADSLYSVYLSEPLPRRNVTVQVIEIPRDTPTTPSRSMWSGDSQTEESPNGVPPPPPTPTYTIKNRLKTYDLHGFDDDDGGDDEAIAERERQRIERTKHLLHIPSWLEMVINLCRTERSWEIYFHLVDHLADQLMNKAFFIACNPQIMRLREAICQQLINSHLPDLNNFNNQKRIEVITRLHTILTVLIGYHSAFLKAGKDELVRCFQINMGRYNPVLTKQCIHSLMVCCHELPKSIARCLSGILQTLSHQITNPVLSVHILEFLVGVGRIPKIHGSFTYEEFSMVFQVALKFLQHSRATARERPNNTDSQARMSQYITYLAYEALTVWFLAVRLENRRAHVSWIIRQLILANDSTGLDDHALVFVDMLERFSYSDSPLRKYPDTADVDGLAQYKKHWVVGRSIQTAQVVREDGLVKVTVRKPASMLVTYMQAEVDFDSDAIRTGRKVLTTAELNTLPSYMISQVHSTDQPPLLLSEDESTMRSIRSLDRMPVVNFHTIGITYVGWGQTTEEEILSNEVGSLEYQSFLDGMGTLVRLKGNTEIYHGGLDIEDDQDGTHAYFWSDRTTQITFITYTMIPLNKEGDRLLALSNKKRNAANCFVNIIWNDTNEPYSLNTIASEFNSNSIVISRHSRSASETDTVVSSESNPQEKFFKVKLIQTEGMPEVSPIMDEKIVSATSLAPFVRSVALKLSIFCQIYIGRQEKSHWVARLDQIKQIRDRALQKRNSDSIGPRGALSPSISNATLSTMGRRGASTDSSSRSDSHASSITKPAEDDPLTQWLSKYDFSRYT